MDLRMLKAETNKKIKCFICFGTIVALYISVKNKLIA